MEDLDMICRALFVNLIKFKTTMQICQYGIQMKEIN